MYRFFILLLLFLLLPSVAFAVPELKGSPEELTSYLSELPEEVVLQGEAKLELPAESGVVTLGIKVENPQLQKALLNSGNLRTTIIEQLVGGGLSRDGIKETKFSSTPEYGLFGKKPNNYVVENLVKVTVKDQDELQQVAGIVDTFDNVYYQGLELDEMDKEEIRTRLIDLALANVKAREEVYEKALGLTLEPVSFEEGISTELPVPRQWQEVKSEYTSMVRGGAGGAVLSFGDHVYSGFVRVRYQVKQQ